MLEFIRERASDRKMRLFAVACCRRVEAWTKYADKICGTTEFADSSSEPFNRGDDYRNAIHIAERFADGEATPGELNAACGAADNNLLSEGWICDCDPFVSVALTDIAEVALTARGFRIRASTSTHPGRPATVSGGSASGSGASRSSRPVARHLRQRVPPRYLLPFLAY